MSIRDSLIRGAAVLAASGALFGCVDGTIAPNRNFSGGGDIGSILARQSKETTGATGATAVAAGGNFAGSPASAGHATGGGHGGGAGGGGHG